MANPAVSVVLPCFNAAGALPAALKSIRAQTWEDWELLVYDDGSTDESCAIVADFAAKDPRIRLLSSRHAGIVAALQQACAEVRGTFIARMDADDTAYPDRLAKQVSLMNRTPDLALCGARIAMTGPNIRSGRQRYETWVNGLITHEDIVRELFVECPVPHPTFMIRRDAFIEVGGYQDHWWPEDYDLCMRLFMAGKRFGKVAEVLLAWHNSPRRLSTVNERYSPDRFRALKQHYLFQTYLRGTRRFYQWGAGEVGKTWLRAWADRRPQAVIDISPRKIGRTIHGVQVIAPDALPPPGTALVLIAVGAPGARDEIRAWLGPRGYTEQEDYLFIA